MTYHRQELNILPLEPIDDRKDHFKQCFHNKHVFDQLDTNIHIPDPNFNYEILEQVIVRTATQKVVANLTQILNFKANFHQEFELFSKNKFMLTMVDTLRLSSNTLNLST